MLDVSVCVCECEVSWVNHWGNKELLVVNIYFLMHILNYLFQPFYNLPSFSG